MVAVLVRSVVVGPRIPASGQLLDAGDIHVAVVQMALELGHVPGEEGAVGADRVTGQRGLPGIGHIGLDVVEQLRLGVGHAQGCLLQLVEKTRIGVHLEHRLVHLLQCLLGRRDQQVEAFALHLELAIGHQYRDFDQSIGSQVEPGHFTVDPHQHVHHVPKGMPLPRSRRIRWLIQHPRADGPGEHPLDCPCLRSSVDRASAF